MIECDNKRGENGEKIRYSGDKIRYFGRKSSGQYSDEIHSFKKLQVKDSLLICIIL